MSLSSSIIQGHFSEVERLLQRGAPVNVIDEYGYTPLIQTAIMNRPDMTKLLLAHEADVKRQDLAGSTALHWAVDNANVLLSQLLLERGADPNAYNAAGEAVAVKPVLRQQANLRALLHRYGANFDFAQDFIHTKLLGHRFELKGYVDIVNSQGYFVEIDLEGFFLEFTLDTIYRSLSDFQAHFFSKHMRAYLPSMRHLLQVVQQARQLIRYEHYQIEVTDYTAQIDQLLAQPIVLLPVSYEGHAITFVKYGRLLGKCDRSHNQDFKQNVAIYNMAKPLNFSFEFIRRLLYKRQPKQLIDIQLPTFCGMQLMTELPIGLQIAGNCSWANVEASVPVILLFALLRENPGASAVDFDRYSKFAIFFYQKWREWDKDRALHYVISQFERASPARKAAIASLLVAVLFQRCSAQNERDVARAHKIIPILKTPGYEYVLESYIEVYCHRHPSRAGKNLQQLLWQVDACSE